MSQTIRKSEMLKEVRRWRAEAFEALAGETESARVKRTREWSRRLNLPMAEPDDTNRGAHTGLDLEDFSDWEKPSN